MKLMKNEEVATANRTMRRWLRISIYIFLLLALTSCGGADVAMKKGDRFYALGEYYDAAVQYRKAYQQTPPKDKKTRGERALKMADCYRRINYSAKAVSAYNNAVRYGQNDGVTLLRLAQQQMMTGNYKAAGSSFAAAADSISSVIAAMPAERTSAKESMKAWLELAEAGKVSAENAPTWKKEGSRYTVKKENNFNSRRADFSPVLGGENGEILYFSSTPTKQRATNSAVSLDRKRAISSWLRKTRRENGNDPKISTPNSTRNSTRGHVHLRPTARRCISHNVSPIHLIPDMHRLCARRVRTPHGANRNRCRYPRTHCQTLPILPCRPTADGCISRRICLGAWEDLIYGAPNSPQLAT